MNKRTNETATRILALMTVENRPLTIEEITNLYREGFEENKISQKEIFYNGITYLLAENYIKTKYGRKKYFEVKYKLTLKTKLMMR